MATSPAPLVWDFYRTLDTVDSVGGNVHYYDTAAQRIYLNDGIATNVTEVHEGHWEDAEYGDEIIIDDTAYTLLSVDHPHNGTLFMVATDGENLYYLRYVYAMEIGDIVESGTMKTQLDNPIAQLSLQVQNISAPMFTDKSTLFNPGSKLELSLRLGDEDPYPMIIAYIDRVPYDRLADTVSISGRNSIGFRLKDQTFDLDNVYTGYSHEIFAALLELAGLKDYDIEPGTGQIPFTFDRNKSILDGLMQMLEVYFNWRLAELPDGKILLGRESFINSYQANSYYTFEGEKEVFSRNTTKSVDAAYANVLITGKKYKKDEAPEGMEDEEHTPIKLPVNHFDFWALGSHRTCHVTAPDGLSEADFAAYAEDTAERLQYVGIGESFMGPLRPHLLVGDVAEVYYKGESQATSLGLVTEVTHQFGKRGFYTEFTTDSGGVVTDGANYTVISRMAALSGYNRRTRLSDLIKVLTSKSKWGQ